MPDRRDGEVRSLFDLVKNDVSSASERDDQLALERILADLGVDEGRAAAVPLDLASDRVDRRLGIVEILDVCARSRSKSTSRRRSLRADSV